MVEARVPMKASASQIIEKQVASLKRLRLAVFLCLMALNLGITGLFACLFYAAYSERRGVTEGFLSHAGETLLHVHVYFMVICLLVFAVIFRRFCFAISQLNRLDGVFAEVYRRYCEYLPKHFLLGVPDYILSQNGLVIVGNLKLKVLGRQDFDCIRILRISRGRYGRLCKVLIQKRERTVARLVYYGLYPKKMMFLVNNIGLVHDGVVITENPGSFFDTL